MKNIVLTGLVSISLLTACNKQDQKVEGPTLEQQKLEYQAKQLDIEKQKLAIEKEKFAFEQQKKTDSLEKAKQTAVAKTASTQKNYYAGNTNYTPRKNEADQAITIPEAAVVMQITEIADIAMQAYSSLRKRGCLLLLKEQLLVP